MRAQEFINEEKWIRMKNPNARPRMPAAVDEFGREIELPDLPRKPKSKQEPEIDRFKDKPSSRIPRDEYWAQTPSDRGGAREPEWKDVMPQWEMPIDPKKPKDFHTPSTNRPPAKPWEEDHRNEKYRT
jgi:hypothetical protein